MSPNFLDLLPQHLNISKSQHLKTSILSILLFVLPMRAAFSQTDSLPPDSLSQLAVDSLAPRSRLQQYQDSVRESLRVQANFEENVIYSARDSSDFDVVANMLYLYGDASVKYEEFELKADQIWIDFKSQTLYSCGRVDSAKGYVDVPTFVQDGDEYVADSMRYNFKSERAMIYGARTQQGEFYILPERIKKQKDGSFHAQNVKATTCNAEHPHYYFMMAKAKIIPNKQIIAGPTRFVVQDFPIPITLPFAFFPANKKKTRKNGFLSIKPGESPERGFFLENLGYYRALGEYFDLLIQGAYYTRGGWSLGFTSNYKKLYKYSGRLYFDYDVTRFGERTPEFTDPNFRKTKGWNFTWTHRQPINPTTKFSSKVELANSSYAKQTSFDPGKVLTSNLNSSITFNKGFGPFQMSLSTIGNQNLNTNKVTASLPNFNLSMGRQQPFKKLLRNSKSFEWLKKMGLNYTTRAKNDIRNAPDSLFVDILTDRNGQSIVNDPNNPDSSLTLTHRDFWSNGMIHSTSPSTALQLFKYLTIPLSFSYNEYWYFESVEKIWNEEDEIVEDDYIPGFTTARDYSFSTNVNATIYGLYSFKNSKNGTVFRQQFLPRIGFSYKPDFAEERFGYYKNVQSDTLGNMSRYSRFEDAIYQGPSAGERQSLTFALRTILEMKYKKKEALKPDWEEGQDPFKRVSLIKNLGVSSDYNFAADSFQLNNFRLNANTDILNLFGINAGATLDPYVYEARDAEDSIGRRFNKLMWTDSRKLGRITRANASINVNFQSKKNKGKGLPSSLTAEEKLEYQQIKRNPQNYVDFNIPWSISLRYNFNYARRDLRPGGVTTHTINANGDFNLTDKWKISYQTGYNLLTKEVTQTSFTVHRDLHCWDLSFRTIPFGRLQSYSLTLSVKSSMLSFLKLSKQDRYIDRAESVF